MLGGQLLPCMSANFAQSLDWLYLLMHLFFVHCTDSYPQPIVQLYQASKTFESIKGVSMCQYCQEGKKIYIYFDWQSFPSVSWYLPLDPFCIFFLIIFITDFIIIVIIYYIFLLLSFSSSTSSSAAYSFIALFMLFSNPLRNIRCRCIMVIIIA